MKRDSVIDFQRVENTISNGLMRRGRVLGNEQRILPETETFGAGPGAAESSLDRELID